MAVQLAVGGHEDERRARLPPVRAVAVERGRERGHDVLPGEPIGVGGQLRLERDGAGERPVVERHDHLQAAAELDAVRAARLQAGRRRLPRREDRGADALAGHLPERREVCRGLRQPQHARGAAEAEREVAEPPADLRGAVPRRGQREDRVVEALRDGVQAVVRGHDPGERRRFLGRQPGRQGWPHVEADPVQVPALRVGPVALGRDPRIPVRERRGGGVVRKPTGERVAPLRLVEVAVDRQATSSHGALGRQARSA